MLADVDATQALSELTTISPQVRRVAVAAADDSLIVANVQHDEAQRLVAGARRLLSEADAVGGNRGLAAVTQLEVALGSGSVFVVRDGGRLIVATTSPEPTVGLVFYDLKSCLRTITDPGRGDAWEDDGGAA
jgi:predicted regulator of Ras-like GTPase activity (Roadblock/LC7/MglB family)